jgi:hypothetical protein
MLFFIYIYIYIYIYMGFNTKSIKNKTWDISATIIYPTLNIINATITNLSKSDPIN